MYVCTYVCMYLSIYLSFCLSIYLSIDLSIYMYHTYIHIYISLWFLLPIKNLVWSNIVGYMAWKSFFRTLGLYSIEAHIMCCGRIRWKRGLKSYISVRGLGRDRVSLSLLHTYVRVYTYIHIHTYVCRDRVSLDKPLTYIRMYTNVWYIHMHIRM
jgi:hypothetical protein